MLSGVGDGSQSWKKVMRYAIFGSLYSILLQNVVLISEVFVAYANVFELWWQTLPISLIIIIIIFNLFLQSSLRGEAWDLRRSVAEKREKNEDSLNCNSCI